MRDHKALLNEERVYHLAEILPSWKKLLTAYRSEPPARSLWKACLIEIFRSVTCPYWACVKGNELANQKRERWGRGGGRVEGRFREGGGQKVSPLPARVSGLPPSTAGGPRKKKKRRWVISQASFPVTCDLTLQVSWEQISRAILVLKHALPSPF